MDFVKAATRSMRSGGIEVYPKFIVGPTKDLMIRGGEFYAVWLEDKGRWSTDEYEAIHAIDDLLRKKAEELQASSVAYLWDSDTKSIDKWHYYCNKQQHDTWKMLDTKLVFEDDVVKQEDYASKRMPYRLAEGDTSAYEELIGTIYDKDEKDKIEWMIGSILSGDSRKLEKFYVFYGSPGTGKSTVLKLIEALFPGYCQGFDAKALGDRNNDFALEQFKYNPLVAIDHDSTLSRIDSNNRLNVLISHESVMVNEKHKSIYQAEFQTTLIAATNEPVKITDSKSGLIRRLIDINPSGRLVDREKYFKLRSDMEYELGAIAYKCLNFYLANKHLYDDYESRQMMALSNDFYDFMIDNYFDFEKADRTTLSYAYNQYKNYCTEANVTPMRKKEFKSELRSYFSEFYDRLDGDWYVYVGFLKEKFGVKPKPKVHTELKSWLNFDKTESLFDEIFAEMPAQLATKNETPRTKWENVKKTLSEIDTSKLHYVKVPINHIVIDFDMTDESGAKCFKKNFEAASKFPPTYAELSKSGQGIHLHYTYNGDVTRLSHFYDDKIEVKTFPGNAPLRRKLTKCNDIPIKEVSFNLPMKEENKMVNNVELQNERHLRSLIKKSLLKEYGSTVCCVDFIKTLLDEAYNKEGFSYDVSDLSPSILVFAAKSTHQSQKCIQTFSTMKFKSKNFEVMDGGDLRTMKTVDEVAKPIAFFDVEVFPNLFFISWKLQGRGKEKHHMFNPTPEDVKLLCNECRLIGFNNRQYDNHMLYARMLGYSEYELFKLSDRIINLKSQNARFGPAYNLSYTDVYDFASAPNKMSLKKWEIKLRIHHKELGLPWDQPVDEELWPKVAEYCDYDVEATEAVFDHLAEDWTARQILADLAGMSVNSTTNQLTTQIIFGDDPNPQTQFNYRNLGEVPDDAVNFVITADGTIYKDIGNPEYTKFDTKGRPVFPGYKFEYGKSSYRGEDPKEGGCVRAVPGIHYNVALLDVASMHPTSILCEELFGPVYSRRYGELRQARIYIKRKDFDKARTMLDGKLAKYLADEDSADSLSTALKTPINAVYGLTSAHFDNKFRDPRNIDNIVAKRGALFMINLKHEVEDRGFTVAHIKTDSIKIPDATPDIIQFVMDYGKMYGYEFEYEAHYEKMCLVNNAVYIAKYSMNTDINKPKHGHDIAGTWTATGAEFAHPYIFKRLFSHEEIKPIDLAETKEVKDSSIYLDFNENNPEDHEYTFVGKVGQFTPVKDGCGGGRLVKEAHDSEGNLKYDSVTGSLGYRWVETEGLTDDALMQVVNMDFYNHMADAAIDHINEFGDFYAFSA